MAHTNITFAGNVDLDALIADALITEEIEADKQAAYEAQAAEINAAEAERQAINQYERAEYIPGDLQTIAKNLEADTVKRFTERVDLELHERAAYETNKNPNNIRIHKYINGNRRMLCSERAVRIMLACDVNANFINNHIKSDERYNVYAMEKVGRFIQQLDFAMSGNFINDAIFKTMWNFNKAGIEFDLDAAKCAASHFIRLKEGQKHWAQHLVRHTVSKGVASTQSGSTMRAMETLGLVSLVKKVGTRMVYRLNDNPQVRRIAEILALN